MNLIEKIDAEIKESEQYGCESEYRAGLYKAKEIILSEQKEPCEYCTENPCWLCKSAGECQTWQHCAGNDRIDYSPVQNYCHVCGRPLNQPYTE